MKKCYFIVNPVSGAGNAEKAFHELEPRLKAEGIEYTAVFTRFPGHATELAKAALEEGYRYIAAVGGDGTLNETAQALVGTDAVLCALPFGTGNDLKKSVGFPDDPDTIIKMLTSGREIKMDACLANSRIFINVAGLGFDVDVLEYHEKYKKKYRGMMPYLLAIVDALKHLRTIHLTMSHDGEEIRCDGLILSVGNGQYIGGGMHAVPMGDPFDGMLDCVYIEKVTVPKFLYLLPKFLKGRHLRFDVVHHIRTAELTVSCPEKCKLNVDGEVVDGTPVTFKVLPGALNILLPEEN